jgi:hypothetical protein
VPRSLPSTAGRETPPHERIDSHKFVWDRIAARLSLRDLPKPVRSSRSAQAGHSHSHGCTRDGPPLVPQLTKTHVKTILRSKVGLLPEAGCKLAASQGLAACGS